MFIPATCMEVQHVFDNKWNIKNIYSQILSSAKTNVSSCSMYVKNVLEPLEMKRTSVTIWRTILLGG